ncbi:hypothetical protein TNIN_166431 [Trichonephila inaurata madagascariensis]|uniref:Uncharacterized protein n=1 Tax=Trichonephila inaurata madagascariensis TaxID=2747483 RepID=A0A8X6M8Q0_9ARAC|nr:hypothetical protein TNIN_166431 [Trichonephila inaurata madagascariensis]
MKSNDTSNYTIRQTIGHKSRVLQFIDCRKILPSYYIELGIVIRRKRQYRINHKPMPIVWCITVESYIMVYTAKYIPEMLLLQHILIVALKFQHYSVNYHCKSQLECPHAHCRNKVSVIPFIGQFVSLQPSARPTGV